MPDTTHDSDMLEVLWHGIQNAASAVGEDWRRYTSGFEGPITKRMDERLTQLNPEPLGPSPQNEIAANKYLGPFAPLYVGGGALVDLAGRVIDQAPRVAAAGYGAWANPKTRTPGAVEGFVNDVMDVAPALAPELAKLPPGALPKPLELPPERVPAGMPQANVRPPGGPRPRPPVGRPPSLLEDQASPAATAPAATAPAATAPSSPIVVPSLLQGAAGQRGIINPQRIQFPGVYDNPKTVVADAVKRVAPENPMMKRLFGVDRADLYDIGGQGARQGNMEPKLQWPANPKGSAAAANVTTDENAQRLIDVLAEAKDNPSDLWKGMTSWYVMDPAYKRLEQLVGPDRARVLYNRFNTFTSVASPGSEVEKEVNRGTAAHVFYNEGRWPDFAEFGGGEPKMPKVGEKDYDRKVAKYLVAKKAWDENPLRRAGLEDVFGHPYHSTAHMSGWGPYDPTAATGGDISFMESPKVPLYQQASGVPETGFQTSLPVGDAHFVRGIGLSDARTAASSHSDSISMPELHTLGPWWLNKVARPMGIEPVPAQGATWGIFSTRTGVKSRIGAPKLELLTKRIEAAAKRLGITPEEARDRVLLGQDHADLSPDMLLDAPAPSGGMLA